MRPDLLALRAVEVLADVNLPGNLRQVVWLLHQYPSIQGVGLRHWGGQAGQRPGETLGVLAQQAGDAVTGQGGGRGGSAR